MRRILAALPLVLVLTQAHADTVSARIAKDGLASVEAQLAALPAPTNADTFALGGVQFLRAIEISFQDRWRMGMTDRSGMLPLLRLPVPDNPAPAKFDPASVTALFTKASAELDKAQASLAKIPETSDFGVEIALGDLWFDVNANGTRDSGEGLSDIVGSTLLGGAPDSGTAPQPLPTVRFDLADAAWLAAYANLLNAVCDLVRAYDPTEPLTRIIAAHDTMAAMGPYIPDPLFGSMTPYDPAKLDGFDLFAVVLASLNQPPDQARMTSARAHLLAMVAENRSFWTRVALEKDNNQEWLPNDHQQSAIGIELPPGTGPKWLALLSDVEAVLKGEKLLPFWRVGPPVGINLAKFFANPGPIDLAGWMQGWAVLPYLETGNVVTTANSEAFDNLVQGQSMLFALYLN